MLIENIFNIKLLSISYYVSYLVFYRRCFYILKTTI